MLKENLKWWHWLSMTCGLCVLAIAFFRLSIISFRPPSFTLFISALVALTLASATFLMAVIRFLKMAWSYVAALRSNPGDS